MRENTTIIPTIAMMKVIAITTMITAITTTTVKNHTCKNKAMMAKPFKGTKKEKKIVAKERQRQTKQETN